jgi:hypothetical protein
MNKLLRSHNKKGVDLNFFKKSGDKGFICIFFLPVICKKGF